MADEFDTTRAMREQRALLERVQTVRNLLTHDIIDYNWEKQPRSEADAERIRTDIRKWLRDAHERIDSILRDL
ncbi:MAG TPA: hypothetical protein VEA92_01160 [Candidatus Paceibacterota bacterium]|nr:hypothetical protein [Candidatus Paceibacterota bacterium]